MKQSKPPSLRSALQLVMVLESYRLASCQRDLHVREMSNTPIEETLTVPLDGKKSQQEDVLVQFKGLLEEIRAPKGNMQSYSGTWMRDQLCWACGKRRHVTVKITAGVTQETCSCIAPSLLLGGRTQFSHALLLMRLGTCTRIAKTNMPLIQRSLYLLDARTIFTIFLRN